MPRLGGGSGWRARTPGTGSAPRGCGSQTTGAARRGRRAACADAGCSGDPAAVVGRRARRRAAATAPRSAPRRQRRRSGVPGRRRRAAATDWPPRADPRLAPGSRRVPASATSRPRPSAGAPEPLARRRRRRRRRRSVTSTPRRAASSAASPAPPGRSRTRRTSTTGTGASGHSRSPAEDVAVEQRRRRPRRSVRTAHADLGQRRRRAGGVAQRRGRRSRAAHRACTATRCTSWTAAVDAAATASTSSASVGERVRAGPGQRPHGQPGVAAALGRRAARCGLRPLVDSSTSTSPGRPCACTCRANISLDAVVVDDRRQAGGLGAQRDRRQRPPLVAEPADQLGGEVLRLGGAAAVAGGQQPAAAAEDAGELVAPALDQRGLAARASSARAAERQVPVESANAWLSAGALSTAASTGAILRRPWWRSRRPACRVDRAR